MNSLAVKNDSHIVQINSKFGPIKIDLNDQLYFPQGLVGMPKARRFCLIDCPIEKFRVFKLLQSLDDESLVFLVKPHNFLVEDYIDKSDIINTSNDYNIPTDNLKILLIASAKTLETGKVITLNMRAPLFVDSLKSTVHQVVFLNENYNMQHIM